MLKSAPMGEVRFVIRLFRSCRLEAGPARQALIKQTVWKVAREPHIVNGHGLQEICTAK